MKNYLTLLFFSCLITCKKNITSEKTQDKQLLIKTDSSFQFKSFGKSIIKDYSFPKEWKVNTYDDNIKLKKEDIDAQKKLEQTDYFNTIKGKKDEHLNPKYFSFIKKDSVLKISKIDSLFVMDSITLHDTRKIFTFKTIATLEDDNYEFPVKIFKLDIALFNEKNILETVNIYSEIDFPYSTNQKTCYLDSNGNLYCKKFSIEEDKVFYKGFYRKNLKKEFNIK